MALDPEKVKSALTRLRPFSDRIFGAAEHRFEVNAPLADQEVQRFEAQHLIQLLQSTGISSRLSEMAGRDRSMVFSR